MTELFITQEDIERLKARDERWRQVDTAMAVDAELRDSVALNLIIEAAVRHTESAKEALLHVNPADTKAIIGFQAKGQCAKFIGDTLRSIRETGLNAAASLDHDGAVELDREGA